MCNRKKTYNIIQVNMPLPCNSDDDFIVQPRTKTELLEVEMFRTECLTDHHPRSDSFSDVDQKSRPPVRDQSVFGQSEEHAKPDGRPERIVAVKTVQADQRKYYSHSRSYAFIE